LKLFISTEMLHREPTKTHAANSNLRRVWEKIFQVSGQVFLPCFLHVARNRLGNMLDMSRKMRE